jgi:hypothetical protein
MQFETQFAPYRKDRREAGEVHSPITAWRRGQSHRKPTFRVHVEQADNIGAVHRWEIGPVLDVADEVVYTYGVCIQRMTKADDKGSVGEIWYRAARSLFLQSTRELAGQSA